MRPTLSSSHCLLALQSLLLAASSACNKSPGGASTGSEVSHATERVSAGPAWFEDITAEAGVDFKHVSGHADRFLMPEIMGGGGALFDIDNDGDLDLYLVNSGSLHETVNTNNPPTNQLYLNNGDGTFTNITGGSGADDSGYGMGCAVGDFNNDGFADIYITNVGPNVLLKNNGDNTFTDVSATAGVAHPGWGTSAAFFDYDRDGDLDLFAANYLNWSVSTELDCYNNMGGKDYCSPQNYNAPAMDVLYQNKGDGTFIDVTAQAGMSATFGTGLGVVVADFDNNGWLDVFVANDGMKDQLWANTGNGTFIDTALRAGCAVDLDGTEKAGMGVAVADLDDDGDFDLIVCNLNQQSDSLFRNDNGFFADVTSIAGLGTTSRPFTRFGMAWHDFNNDGLLDLYQVNGRVMMQAEMYPSSSPLPEGEGQGEGSSTPAKSQQPKAKSPDPYAEPNLLFKGVGPFKFEEVTPRGGTQPVISATGRAGIFGDIDNDGDTDIIIVNRDGPVTVLRNIATDIPDFSSNTSITFHTVDEHGRTVEHAIVSATVGEKTIHRESRSAYSYLAANDPRISIGLGNEDKATNITVTWPDGTTETFGDFNAGQFVTLKRGSGRK